MLIGQAKPYILYTGDHTFFLVLLGRQNSDCCTILFTDHLYLSPRLLIWGGSLAYKYSLLKEEGLICEL